MATTIAYGEITILDLIDTATYIYYSANENGEGATIAPSTDSQYIGIYSGPPIKEGQPLEPPDETVWSKYVGPQGEPGEGVTVIKTEYKYRIGESGEWVSEMPQANPGEILYIETTIYYSDGNTTSSISYSYMGTDGEDGDAYKVETNQEEILKFQTTSGWDFSPSQFVFTPKKNKNVIISNTDFSFKLFLSYSTKDEEISLEIPLNLTNEYTERKENNTEEETHTSPIVEQENDYYKLHLDKISELYNQYINNQEIILFYKEKETRVEVLDDFKEKLFGFLEKNNSIFRFNILKQTGELEAIKPIICRNGMNEDMASFSLQAHQILQAVQDTYLTFSANGLTLKNGAFTILNKDNELLLGAEGDNLFVKGTIHATDGVFSGELVAPTGKIGGFYITPNELRTSLVFYELDESSTEEEYVEGKYYIFSESEYIPITPVFSQADSWIEGQKYYRQDLENNLYEQVDNLTEENFGDGTYFISDYNSENNYYLKIDNSSLTLNGEEGSIYAKNITLGSNATIEKYIALGKAKIFNPHYPDSNGNVLQTGNITISQDGYINVGSINIFGGTGAGDAYLQSSNENWKIYENGRADFKDIYADNVHLSNTILEIGTIQNVGSLMIFKDAFAPVSFSNGKLEFEDITSFKEGDWLYNGQSYYQVSEIRENGKEIELTTNYNELELQLPLSKFGAINKDFVFSAFGDYDSEGQGYPFASPYSITLADFSEEDGSLSFNKRLVLGKLDGVVKDSNVKGIGLYADNVYLKGSLISEGPIHKEVVDKFYSGINTQTGVPMPIYLDGKINEETGKEEGTKPYFPDSNIKDSEGAIKEYISGEILLWAGARLDINGNVDIRKAPFKVDSLGNFYAGSGYFEGSIISKATIKAARMEAAEIYTATLKGWGNDQDAVLKIQDAANGIEFYRGETNLFSIREKGFVSNEIDFISIGDKSVSSTIYAENDQNQYQYNSSIDEDGKLQLKYFSISKDESNNANLSVLKTSFEINDGIIVKIGEGNNNKIIEVDSEQTKVVTNVVFDKNISYAKIMEYKQTKDKMGYDLYIN